jgi:hypothetical protein
MSPKIPQRSSPVAKSFYADGQNFRQQFDGGGHTRGAWLSQALVSFNRSYNLA